MAITINETEFTTINFIDQNKRADMKTTSVFQSITQGLADIGFTNDLFHLITNSTEKIFIIFLAPNKKMFEFYGINNSSDLFWSIVSHDYKF